MPNTKRGKKAAVNTDPLQGYQHGRKAEEYRQKQVTRPKEEATQTQNYRPQVNFKRKEKIYYEDVAYVSLTRKDPPPPKVSYFEYPYTIDVPRQGSWEFRQFLISIQPSVKDWFDANPELEQIAVFVWDRDMAIWLFDKPDEATGKGKNWR